MITLLDLSFVIEDRKVPEVLFENVTLHVAPFERVGIIGSPGAGKTTLARIISGMIPQSDGHILQVGKVSPPIGYGAALHPELSVLQNIRILCRASGDDPEEAVALCASLGRLEQALDQPVKNLSAKDRRSLSFVLSMAVAADMYVADESLAFGDAAQREDAAALLERRLETAGIVFLSSNIDQLRKTCHRFYRLRSTGIEECTDLQQAAGELKAEKAKCSVPASGLLGRG